MPISQNGQTHPSKFAGNLPTNCLSVFGHFVGLAFKGLISDASCSSWQNNFFMLYLSTSSSDLICSFFRLGLVESSCHCTFLHNHLDKRWGKCKFFVMRNCWSETREKRNGNFYVYFSDYCRILTSGSIK